LNQKLLGEVWLTSFPSDSDALIRMSVFGLWVLRRPTSSSEKILLKSFQADGSLQAEARHIEISVSSKEEKHC
jgi:hypothetical protein